jgi:hypothetical protein
MSIQCEIQKWSQNKEIEVKEMKIQPKLEEIILNPNIKVQTKVTTT